MNFTTDQQQIILGTVLGNSFLESPDGFYLVMRSRSPEWLASKAKVLRGLEQATWKSRSNYYWRSSTETAFEEIDSLCYEGHEKVARMDCLNKLKRIGLMAWYGDSGCLVGRKRRNASLRTQSLGLSTEAVCCFFNEVDMPCNVNQVRDRPVIVFTLAGTERLMNVIGPVLPKNRHHLVPDHLRIQVDSRHTSA